MLSLISKAPSYYLFRMFGWPLRFPMNLTLSVSYRCNSRCRTCNVYKKEAKELSSEEWKKVFQGLGKSPFWVTISGGEPFLRGDLTELVCSLNDYCRPSVINIPTNGILAERIPDIVSHIALHCREAQIVINVSIDEIEKRHDVIRGNPGSYEKAVSTFSALKALEMPNLSVGIHTVISMFNVLRIPEIYRTLRELRPDSYITEIAEERVELDTVHADITPEYEDYARAVDFLSRELEVDQFNKMGKITCAFRIQYYKMVKEIIKREKQIIPCYAGFASAQIAPDGDVWICCVKADPIGNLREAGYDFRKVWFSDRARQMRENIKNAECYCPLANASYTNMLYDLKSLFRVGWNYIRM